MSHFNGDMEYKSINNKIGSPDGICVFATPKPAGGHKLLLGQVSDKEDFLKENPTCTKWALLVDAPDAKKPKPRKQ